MLHCVQMIFMRMLELQDVSPTLESTQKTLEILMARIDSTHSPQQKLFIKPKPTLIGSNFWRRRATQHSPTTWYHSIICLQMRSAYSTFCFIELIGNKSRLIAKRLSSSG
ncbi:hypothetical protein L5515_005868 [Caenorhabditis briggsae]|uniref:Uncharacterized protein n=1 Tax=Caenorhabditis briggsae TaxID=6238 RepID=A0AAE9EZ29_CAEBR|nr:hypothetical protein L5515_005868 [Caenorhabditis briggsae]